MKLHMQILIALGLGIKRNWHIFFGIIAGIFVGIFLYAHPNDLVANILSFVGQVFIRLIQMVVIPLWNFDHYCCYNWRCISINCETGSRCSSLYFFKYCNRCSSFCCNCNAATTRKYFKSISKFYSK